MISVGNEQTVIFRCDATSQTGLGHAGRSLALAEALVDVGCACIFLGHFLADARSRLQSSGMVVVDLQVESWGADDAAALTQLVARHQAIGVVVDSYVAESVYLASIERGVPVLLIDDFAERSEYPCSAILNFTSGAAELPYPAHAVRCYLGFEWFLARRTLRALRARGTHPAEKVERILVASGGSDPFDIILSAVSSLLECSDELIVRVVTRPGYEARPQLVSLLRQFRGETAVLSALPDLTAEFERIDLCVASAGLTKYEAAYVGLPAGVVAQTEGQARDTRRLEARGMTFDLGMASEIDRGRLTRQVGKLLEDTALRIRLRNGGLANFPPDPTASVAHALLAEVFRHS